MTKGAGRPRAHLPVAGLAAAGIAVLLIESRASSFHALPWLQPDSASYLEANIARTPAYPAILRAVSILPGGLTWLGPIQHVAVVAAALWLAAQFARSLGHPLLAWVLFATVVLNPSLVSYCFAVLPEALFVAVLMAHLACVLTVADGGWRRGAVAGIGVTAAALALLKPAGYAAVAGLAVLAFEWRRDWRRWHWMIAPAAGGLLLACAANFVTRGLFATQAQGGYSRVAYVGHLLDDATPTPYRRVSQEIARETAGARDALVHLPNATVYYLVAANEYHVVERVAQRAIVAEIARERGRPVDDDRLFPRDPSVIVAINKIGGPIADAAIRGRPGDYARQVTANLYGLWWLPLIQNSETLPALRATIDAELARHSVLDRSPIPFRAMPWPAFMAVKAVLFAIVACSLIAIGFVWSSSPARRAVGYVGLLLHGYFLLVSTVQPGLPRYALAFWPASMLLLFGTIATLGRDRSA